MTREWTLIKYKRKKYLDIYLFKLTNIQFKNAQKCNQWILIIQNPCNFVRLKNKNFKSKFGHTNLSIMVFTKLTK